MEIHLCLSRLEFNHQVLVADIVDEAILGVVVMNAYGFKDDFKNNVLRIGGEEVMLSLIHIYLMGALYFVSTEPTTIK